MHLIDAKLGRQNRVRISMALALSMIALLAGCAARHAPDIRGRWKSVNHFAETTEAIPLHPLHVFYPSPMDGTLKTMLTRWAKDSEMTLSYLHPSDFTLYAPVVQIHTSNLEEAVALLTAIYAQQKVSISTNKNEIVVRPVESTQSLAPFGEAEKNAKN